MSALHTKGPWSVCQGDAFSSSGIDAPDGTAVVWWTSSVYDEGIPNHADAVRIVACVNACEGIPNEALKDGVVKDMLEALQAWDQYDTRPDDGPNAGIQMMQDYDRAMRLTRAAIAKATGETK